ncbi:ABC transporter permease [Liquorilactobacillus nagelii]|uniref:ABC transporter permease n=1 Tax=Liquorilactobacillus nagelii TaxID=82688 RepID=UPI0039E73D75
MRIQAMIKRILLEMVRDKRTLALMFLAPLLILTLMYFLFQSNTQQNVTLGIRNVEPSITRELKGKHIKLKKIKSKQSAIGLIRQRNYAGVLEQKDQKLKLTLQNSDQSKSAILRQTLQQAQIKLRFKAADTALRRQRQVIKQQQQVIKEFAQLTKQTEGSVVAKSKNQSLKTFDNYSVRTHYLYGSSHSTYFDTLLPIMIGFVVFFFVFLISGIALLRERTTGTLMRVLATPIKRAEIITGYLAGYGLFAVVQTCLIVGYSLLVFKIQIIGSLGLVFLINLCLAFVALALGLFISTFAQSEFQMVQFIPVVVIPQIFFSGIIPIAQMPNWLQPVAKIMPLYYGADAMSGVITRGSGWNSVGMQISVLIIFAILFLLLNSITLRRFRQV